MSGDRLGPGHVADGESECEARASPARVLTHPSRARWSACDEASAVQSLQSCRPSVSALVGTLTARGQLGERDARAGLAVRRGPPAHSGEAWVLSRSCGNSPLGGPLAGPGVGSEPCHSLRSWDRGSAALRKQETSAHSPDGEAKAKRHPRPRPPCELGTEHVRTPPRPCPAALSPRSRLSVGSALGEAGPARSPCRQSRTPGPPPRSRSAGLPGAHARPQQQLLGRREFPACVPTSPTSVCPFLQLPVPPPGAQGIPRRRGSKAPARSWGLLN